MIYVGSDIIGDHIKISSLDMLKGLDCMSLRSHSQAKAAGAGASTSSAEDSPSCTTGQPHWFCPKQKRQCTDTAHAPESVVTSGQLKGQRLASGYHRMLAGLIGGTAVTSCTIRQRMRWQKKSTQILGPAMWNKGVHGIHHTHDIDPQRGFPLLHSAIHNSVRRK